MFRSPSGVYLYYPSEKGLIATVLFTPNPYIVGSSSSHLDKFIYSGSQDYIMRPTGQLGAGIDSFIPGNKNGPIGKHTLGILRSMGYIILQKK
jgi:hypothetical protein